MEAYIELVLTLIELLCICSVYLSCYMLVLCGNDFWQSVQLERKHILCLWDENLYVQMSEVCLEVKFDLYHQLFGKYVIKPVLKE